MKARAPKQPPLQTSWMVLSAVKKLASEEGAEGARPKEVLRFINQQFKVRGKWVKSNVDAALKWGVEFGVLQRPARGLYLLGPGPSPSTSSTSHGAGSVNKFRNAGPGSQIGTNQAEETADDNEEGALPQDKSLPEDDETRVAEDFDDEAPGKELLEETRLMEVFDDVMREKMLMEEFARRDRLLRKTSDKKESNVRESNL